MGQSAWYQEQLRTGSLSKDHNGIEQPQIQYL
jgi:hypothetical protein